MTFDDGTQVSRTVYVEDGVLVLTNWRFARLIIIDAAKDDDLELRIPSESRSGVIDITLVSGKQFGLTSLDLESIQKSTGITVGSPEGDFTTPILNWPGVSNVRVSGLRGTISYLDNIVINA